MRLHAIAAGPGVILNLAKCVLDPTQIIEFLGFPVDSKSVISLPQDKITKGQKQCCRMLSRKSASARVSIVNRYPHLSEPSGTTSPILLSEPQENDDYSFEPVKFVRLLPDIDKGGNIKPPILDSQAAISAREMPNGLHG